jgi:hypothetical protein
VSSTDNPRNPPAETGFVIRGFSRATLMIVLQARTTFTMISGFTRGRRLTSRVSPAGGVCDPRFHRRTAFDEPRFHARTALMIRGFTRG